MAVGESFAGVLEAARVGAEWAWRALYADTAPDLLRYARASRAPDPEDVVGETFLQAVRGLGSFGGDERGFRAWLFTLARNRIVDDHRKLVRRRTEPLPVEVLAEIGPHADAETDALRAFRKIASGPSSTASPPISGTCCCCGSSGDSRSRRSPPWSARSREPSRPCRHGA
jgi:DNA-directed RNA polymerase specialized sigma24 family protein